MAELQINRLESWIKSVRQISPNLRIDLNSLRLRIESRKDKNHLESKILSAIPSVDSALANLQSCSPNNPCTQNSLSESTLLKDRVDSLNSLLRQYRKNRRLSPKEMRQLDKIKKAIENILENKSKADSSVPCEKYEPNRLLPNNLNNISRDQILRQQSKVDPFLYERDLRLNELTSRAAEKNEKKESLPRYQNILPASGLLSSFTDAFIARELTRSINSTPSVSTLALQNLVSGLNAELTRLLSQPNTDFTCRVVYEESQNSFRIQISGKLSEAEIVKNTHRVVADKPAQMLPLLSEAAAKLIEKNPENKAEILRLVSEIVNSNSSSIKEEEIIATTMAELESQQPKTVNLDNQYEVRLEIAKSILEKLTPAAVPALLAENERIAGTNNPIAMKVLEPTIIGLAQNIIRQANETASINMVGKSKSDTDVATLIVLANKNKLPAQLDFNIARSLLELVKEAQDCMKLVGIKNLDRTMKRIEAAEKRRNKPATQTTVQKPIRAAKAEPSLTKIINARQALQELVRTAETASLSIPKTLYYVIGNIYAGLAGITAQPQKRMALPFEVTTNFEESRATSSLKRVLAALEADIAKAVGRDPSTQAKRLALAAEILLYGIIMRKVKADIDRVDEIIKAIKKHKKFLKGLLNNIKSGNEEDTVNAIDNLILQADKLSYLKDGFDKDDLNRALEMIITLESAQKEVSHKTPEIYTIAA